MATVNLYLDTRRAKKDGTFPVKFNIHHVGQILITTEFSVPKEEWTGTEFTKKHPNYKVKNMALHNMEAKIHAFLLEMDSKGELVHKSDTQLKQDIKSLLFAKHNTTKGKSLIEVMREFISKKSNEGTKTVYTTTMNKVESFDPEITIDTIDRKWLERFEQWMAETLKVNAYAIHLRNIRAIMNYAIDEEYTTNYPFRKFKIKTEETRKRFVPLDKLRQLRDYPCEEYQQRYRDIFMLMIYLIGINAADLFTAKKTNVVNGRLEYKRAKTGKLYSIQITPEAQAIIDRYAGNIYLLNIMESYGNYKDFLHRMDVGLKQIGTCERKGLGGKKHITPLIDGLSTYWSRHTWASMAAQLDIPKETIAHALGHSWATSTTTDIYIMYDERKVDEANRRVIDYINADKTAKQ